MKTGSNLSVHCKWLYFLAVSALMLVIPLKSGGATYYVANNGSNSNPGTLASPWLTVTYALSRVAAGDTVQLRAGKYCESDKYITGLNGNSSAWITIESYPGERAWITGSLSSTFESGGGWQQLSQIDSNDSNDFLYRSITPFTTTNKLGGWLLDSNGQLTDGSPQLLQYVDPALAVSTNYVTPNCYVGPGIYAQNGYIYIRLKHNPNDTKDRNGSDIDPIPSDANPNNNKILIFTNERIFTFYGSSYIRLRNLDLGPGYCVLRMSNNSNHIEVDGCNIYFKNTGVAADSGCTYIEVKNCKLNMGFPEWIYWDDVKNTFKPADASGWNAFACYGVWNNSSVHDNTFINCFDGVLVYSGSVDSQIYNNKFIRGRDDAIDLSVDVSNIEVYNNIIRHCNEGISIIANNGGTIGNVYIHNNVDDMTGYHREARPVSAGANATWSSGIPWGRHGYGDSCYGTQWKVYNNTIIARDCNNSTTLPKPSPNYHSYFYNNITLLLDNMTIDTSALEDSSGNVFWRTTGGLSGFSEDGGLETDPAYDLSKITSESGYDTSTMWELYKPGNPMMLTTGVDYSGLGCINTSGLNYRGASINALGGWWEFNNNAADSSGLDNNGVVYGGTSYSTDSKAGAYSISLDGSNGYVEVPGSISLNVTKSLMISAWIKPLDLDLRALQGIVTKLTGGSSKQYALSISSTGQLVFDYEYSGNNYQLRSATNLIIENQWQQVGATVDGSRNIKLYINGVNVISDTAPAEPVATTEPVAIGRWGGTYDSNYFKGLIDDVRINGFYSGN